MSLQQKLESLSTELAKADQRTVEVEVRVGKAETELLDKLNHFKTRAAELVPPALAVSTELVNGKPRVESALERLSNQLDGLQGDLRTRSQKATTKVNEMLAAVQSLSTMLKRVDGEIRAEQSRTETALAKAAQRSSEAFASSRKSMGDLNHFVRESYLPQLTAHESATRESLDKLTNKINDTVIPELESQVKATQDSIRGLVGQLQQSVQTEQTSIRSQAEEDLKSADQSTRTALGTLTAQTKELSDYLQAVVDVSESEQKKQQESHSAWWERITKVGPEAAAMIDIPLDLQLVLRKAKVIR